MRKYLVLVSVSVLAAGCASATPTQKGALGGSAIGAGLGAIIGHQSGHTAEGALIGAAAGGVGGALVGDAAATQFCPTCGRDYFGDQTHCQMDGTPLRHKGAPAQTSSAQPQQEPTQESLPKFCSSCGRSYSASTTYCPEDGSALKTRQ